MIFKINYSANKILLIFTLFLYLEKFTLFFISEKVVEGLMSNIPFHKRAIRDGRLYISVVKGISGWDLCSTYGCQNLNLYHFQDGDSCENHQSHFCEYHTAYCERHCCYYCRTDGCILCWWIIINICKSCFSKFVKTLWMTSSFLIFFVLGSINSINFVLRKLKMVFR